MAADGQIVLGLNISETTSQISADLSTILNGLGTKQLILKAAIEKSQVEKGVASLVKEINQETAKIGIEVDPKSVSKVITQQQKMASMQKELVQQMEKYKQAASDVGLTLKGATQNSFKSAIDANDFKAAKESLRSVKKEIDEYNTAIKKMNEDTKLDFDIQNIQSKFSVLKNQTDSVKTLFKQLEQSQENFNNATSNPQKLQYYNELKGVIGQLEVEYQALKQSESALAIDSGIKKQMQDMDTYVKNLKATYSTIGDSAGAEKLKNAIQELDTVLQNVDRNAVGGKLATEWEAVTEKVNAAKRAVSEYRAEQSVISKKVDILDSISEKAGTMKLNIDTSGIAGSGIIELSKRFDELSSRAKQLKSELQDLDPSNGEDVQRLTQEVRKLQDEFNNLSKSSNVFKDTASIQKFTGDIEKARSKVSDYAATYSAIKSRPDLVRELEQLQAAAANISTPAELKKFNSEFDTFNSKVVQAGVHCKSFGDQIKQAFQNFSAFFSASFWIYQVIDSIKQMVPNVIALNTAMVELRKVTDGTENQFNTFLKNAKGNAVKLGSTVTDLVNATSAFSRLGYFLDESEELGRVATIYANVGDDIDNIDQATTSLISTMKGFGLEAGDAINIVDKFNEVGNKFAISSGGIGDALQRSAAAFAAANNTIDESIALVVAANNVIQDPDTVGTMWKTVTMRIRGAKTELEEAGLETEYMAESTASLRDAIKGLTNVDGLGGFDIMKDEKTFKSTYDIILGIGEVWEKMSDIDQAALLELVAGKRQGNALAAILTNLEDLKAALEASENSAGSAMKEQEVWLGSLEAKINQFKASFESLSSTVINEDLVGAIIDFGTNFVHTIDDVINSLGGLGNSLMILVDIIALLNFNKAVGLIQGFWNSFKTGFEIIPKITGTIKNISNAFNLMSEGAAMGGNKVTQFANALTGMNGAAVASTAAIMGVVAVISIAVIAYQNYKQKIEEARQAAEDAANAHNELKGSLEDYKGKIIELRGEIDSGNLSEEEAYNKRKELISIQDELIGKFGEEASGIQLVTGEIESQIAAIDNLGKSNWKEYTQDNIDAIQRAVDLFTDFDPSKVDFWNSPVGGGFEISVPSTGVLWDAINDLDLDMVPADFHDRLEAEFEKADLGIEIPPVGITGDFISDINADSIYDVLETYRSLYDITESLGKEYFGNDYLTYVGTALEGYSSQINSITEAIDQNEEIFNTYVEGLLNYESEYSEVWGQVLTAQKEYQEALLNGDDDAVLAAVEKMNEAQTAWANAGWDNDAVNMYMTDFFDKFTDLSENYQYEIKLKASLADPDDTFGNFIKDAADKLKNEDGKIDLYEVLNAGIEYEDSGRANSRRAVLTEEEQAWSNLKYAAEQYGIAGDTTSDKIENLLRIMDELGYITLDSAEEVEIAAQSFDTLKASASNVISEISNIQSILNSQSSGKSIPLDDFSAEGMSDYQSALEYVNGTMQLNAEKCREIAEAKAEERIATVEANKALAQAEYLENARQIEKYRQKLRDANFENGETAESIQASIDALLDENSALAANCKQYDLLSASIKEAMGSYQHWLNAQNSSDYGDMADDAVSAIERIRDTFDSNSDIFGNFGSKKFDAAVDFIVPDSVDSDDLSAIESYMNNFKQYLKFDSNGDPDGLNIDQFLKNSVEAGLMNYSEDEGWTIAGQKSMEDFAEGLNLSSGVVQAFFDELQLKGAEFDWADEAIKSFGDLAIEANEAAEALRLIDGNDGLKIKVDVSDLSTTNEQITALDTTITEMNTLKSKVNVDPSEIEYANTVIQYCIAQKQLLSQPEVMRVDTTQCSEDVANVISLLQQFQQAQNELEIVQSVGADTTNAKAKVDGLVAEIEALSPEVKTQLGLDTTSIDAIQESINELTADVMVTFGVNDEAIQGYNPETKQCEVIYDPNTDLLPESFDPLSRTVNYQANTKDLPTYFKPLTRTVRYVAAGDTQGGSHRVNGTAQASGTANAGGNWGTASGGKTLVGELGREIVVDPHTGRWYTVGDNGAEFVDIPDGAIVFNHKQTESLLENGYVTGRAAALASGTAMVTGGYKPYKPKVTTPTTKTTTNQIKDATKAAENLEEQLKDTLDELKKTMDGVLNYFNHEMFLMEKKNKIVVRVVPELDDKNFNTGINKIMDFDAYSKQQMDYASQVVAIYKQMQETVHNQAEEYRKLGLDDTSSEIIELQQKWWEYSDSITDAVVNAYDTIVGELENAVTLTDNWLSNAIDTHDYRGIVQYTQDTVEYYQRMQDAIHEQAEFYRSKGYSDASDEVSKLSDLWWDYAEKIKETSANAWQQVVDNANEAVDQITGLYDTLHAAADEFAESGFITIDTLQEILSWGVQYLQYLKDENGMLVINEGSIRKVIAARTEQMAIEQALAYVAQIRTAAEAGNIESLNNLAFATETVTGATWDLVYAQIQAMQMAGQISAAQANAYIENINRMRALADSAKSGIGQVSGAIKEANEAAKKTLEDQEDALNDLLKYVEEMIKQEVKNQVEALEDQVDAMKEIVSLQKKSLDLEKEKDGYTKAVTDKEEAIADLRKQIAALDLDDSREAAAKKAKLQEELSEKINDLADYQSDHAYDAASDMLDDMADAYEKEKQKEIDILENSISSEEKVYRLAIDRINNHWDTLYQDLINWNYEYGSVTNDEITKAWEGASAAVNQYGSYLNAILEIQKQIAAYEASMGSSSNGGANYIVGGSGEYDTSGGKYNPGTIISRMKENSSKWHGLKAANDQAGLDALERDQQNLAQQLRQALPGMKIERKPNGTWYINGEELYKSKYAVYHKGGVVGDDPTLKGNEVIAKLEKGETILTEDNTNRLYQVLNRDDTMLSKFGKLLVALGEIDLMTPRMQEQIKHDSQQAQNIIQTGGDTIEVTAPIQVYTVQKLDEAEIRQLTRDISQHTITALNDSFIKRGKTRTSNPLKP